MIYSKIFQTILLSASISIMGSPPSAAMKNEDNDETPPSNLKILDRGLDCLWNLDEENDAAIQTSTGLRHHNGQGVPQNYEEAMRWYKKAAAQNYARAQ